MARTELRDLPKRTNELTDDEMEHVSGGVRPRFVSGSALSSLSTRILSGARSNAIRLHYGRLIRAGTFMG